MIIKFNKLVRDKVPEQIRDEGRIPVIKIAEEGEYLEKLKEKLSEEVAEFAASGKPEELADILEVVYSLCLCKGVSRNKLEELRKKKLRKSGGFKKKIILKEKR